MTGPQEIAAMETLSQQGAAWLLGITGRALRDRPDVPRNADGTYNARQLVEWARGRVEPPELTDDEVERLLLIRHFAVDCAMGPQIIPVMETLTELQRKYGDRGLAAMAQLLLSMWRVEEAIHREYFAEPTAAEREQAEAARRRQAMEEAARAELRIAVVCERCKRVRHGRRWLETSPPAGFVTMPDTCPRCAKLSE